jgi:hypothetical protein
MYKVFERRQMRSVTYQMNHSNSCSTYYSMRKQAWYRAGAPTRIQDPPKKIYTHTLTKENSMLYVSTQFKLNTSYNRAQYKFPVPVQLMEVLKVVALSGYTPITTFLKRQPYSGHLLSLSYVIRHMILQSCE